MICCVVCFWIFHNSMHSLTQSDKQSGMVMDALNYLSRRLGLHIVFTQFMVRKMAHFTEYFIFGNILTITTRIIWKSLKSHIFFELFLFLAVPVADETVQMFFDGRTSNVLDVLIDFSGCVVGMLIYILVKSS